MMKRLLSISTALSLSLWQVTPALAGHNEPVAPVQLPADIGDVTRPAGSNTTTIAAGAVTAAKAPFAIARTGDTMTGPLNLASPATLTSFTGSYATDGSFDWHLGSSALFSSPALTIPAPSVIGTQNLSYVGNATVSGKIITSTSGQGFTSNTTNVCLGVTILTTAQYSGGTCYAVTYNSATQVTASTTPSVSGSTTYAWTPSNPFVPNQVDASRAMLLINASSTNPNNGETPFTVNLDVSPALVALTNPSTQKSGIQENVLVNPTGGGNCATVTCPSVWAFNPDFRIRGTQGQAALGINTEFDYNNQYGGTDAFQVVNWIAYGGDYPVTAGIYYSNQFTDTYSGSATVSGQNVILTSGSYTSRLASGLYLGGTAGSNFYHVDGVTDATHIHVATVPTTQGSTTYQWSPAGQQYGILMSDNGPNAPLTQSTDILLNTSGYNALQIGGNHVVSIDTSNDVAGTAMTMRGNAGGAGQQLCFSSFDGCQLDYGGSTRHLFLAAGGQTFETDAVASANGYLKTVNASDASTEPTGAFAQTGPGISVASGSPRSDFNLTAAGDGAVVMKSPMRPRVFGISGLPACGAITQGDIVYVYDGNGAPGGPTFHGQVTAATSGQTAAFINSPAYCDGGVWRYL